MVYMIELIADELSADEMQERLLRAALKKLRAELERHRQGGSPKVALLLELDFNDDEKCWFRLTER